jgi:hypothetical protein
VIGVRVQWIVVAEIDVVDPALDSRVENRIGIARFDRYVLDTDADLADLESGASKSSSSHSPSEAGPDRLWYHYAPSRHTASESSNGFQHDDRNPAVVKS